KFRYNISGYDAYAATIGAGSPGIFNIFKSRQWHDLLEKITNVHSTGDIQCGFHHHAIGSRSGNVHNDLNPGWFNKNPNEEGINDDDNSACDYQTGECSSGRDVYQVVRGVAMIFFVCNQPWFSGSGGETGLYSKSDDDVSSPFVTIPPINNSLVVFECTPFSFHSFIT